MPILTTSAITRLHTSQVTRVLTHPLLPLFREALRNLSSWSYLAMQTRIMSVINQRRRRSVNKRMSRWFGLVKSTAKRTMILTHNNMRHHLRCHEMIDKCVSPTTPQKTRRPRKTAKKNVDGTLDGGKPTEKCLNASLKDSSRHIATSCQPSASTPARCRLALQGADRKVLR